MKTDVQFIGMSSLRVYTWDNVLCDYEPGRISVIASSLEQARSAAVNELTDSDDKHYVQVSAPSRVELFKLPFCFTEHG